MLQNLAKIATKGSIKDSVVYPLNIYLILEAMQAHTEETNIITRKMPYKKKREGRGGG